MLICLSIVYASFEAITVELSSWNLFDHINLQNIKYLQKKSATAWFYKYNLASSHTPTALQLYDKGHTVVAQITDVSL